MIIFFLFHIIWRKIIIDKEWKYLGKVQLRLIYPSPGNDLNSFFISFWSTDNWIVSPESLLPLLYCMVTSVSLGYAESQLSYELDPDRYKSISIVCRLYSDIGSKMSILSQFVWLLSTSGVKYRNLVNFGDKSKCLLIGMVWFKNVTCKAGAAIADELKKSLWT